MAPSPSGGSGSFLPLGSSRGGPTGIFSFYSLPALFHFGNLTASGGLGVECLQPSLEFLGKLCVFSSGFGPSCSVQVLAEHVNGQLRHLLLVAPCWMEAPWLPTILNMLEDVPWWCPIVKDLIVDVSVGQVLRGLQYLHLTLWLLSNVCCTDGGSLQPVRWWWGNSNVYIKGLPAVLEGVGQLVCSTGFTKQYHLCPYTSTFFVRFISDGDWPGIPLVSIILLFLHFWSLIAFTRQLIILSFQN